MNWLDEVYGKMIADRSSYRGPSFPSTLTQRKNQINQAVVQMRNSPAADKKQSLASLASDFEIVNDKLGTETEEQWIFLGMVLNAYQNSNLTLEDLQTVPVIKACLEWNPSEK